MIAAVPFYIIYFIYFIYDIVNIYYDDAPQVKNPVEGMYLGNGGRGKCGVRLMVDGIMN